VFLAFQQPLGTSEPSGRTARLSAKEETEAKPERAAGSMHLVLEFLASDGASFDEQMTLFAERVRLKLA
jgi:hypothetical protein